MRILLILSLLFIGCASGPEFSVFCRHKALVAATVVGEKYPVRLVYGESGGQKHVQAQALIDGKWEWISADVYIFVSEKNNRFTPETIFTLEKYLELTDSWVKKLRRKNK